MIALALLLAQDWQSLPSNEWKPIAFKEAGTIRQSKDALILEPGHPMTGVKWTGTFPKINYEITYEAQRARGNDFFGMITFPVGDTHCSFITGGWGGDIIGLSTLDGQTATDNETRAYFNFENNRWYQFRLKVTNESIQVWIGDERVTRINTKDFEIGLRPGDTKLMTPLGFATFATEGWLRNIRWRKTQ